MLDVLSDVVRNLVVIIIVATILELLLPRNDFRPFINMVIGLVLMLTLLAPIRTALRMPVELEPSFFSSPGTYLEADIEVQETALNHLNWELTLGRYRTLLAERIGTVLGEQGYTPVNMAFDMVDDPGHLEFGRLHSVTVWARRSPAGDGPVQPVETVRIGNGRLRDEEGEAGRAAGELARELASALGLERGKVEVYVLNQ